MHDRRTYICVPCRFTSKYAGQCVLCQRSLIGFYDLDTPRKRDDRGWKKLEIGLEAWNSGLVLCRCNECVLFRRPRTKVKDLTLNQFKASIRKRREHPWRQSVPQYTGM